MGEDKGWYVLGLIVLLVIVLIIVREMSKPKTVIEEVVRDEQGRIIQIVRRETS